MLIRHFCDTYILHTLWCITMFSSFSFRELFLCRESFVFFQKRTFVLDNFESYRSLLKSPEFVAPRVSKEAYSAPVLTPPTLYKKWGFLLRISSNWPNPHFNEKIIRRKLHFLCSASWVLSRSVASNHFVGSNSSFALPFPTF